MQKLRKNKYFIAFILSLVVFFAIILILHSYYNVKNSVQPASEQWGRSTSLGASDLYKKQPSIVVTDKYSDILTANKTNFTQTRINRLDRTVEKTEFNIKGVESYKVQSFKWDVNNIYFIESSTLYYATKNPSGGYSSKTKIAEGITDFDLLSSKQGVTIAAINKEGVVVYRQAQNGFEQQGNVYKIDKVTNLSAIEDQTGVIHVAAYAVLNTIDFPVYYLTIKDSNWNLVGVAKERSLSSAWSINEIDIGLDDTDAYIFYDMVKWDQFGISAKVYNAVVPLNVQKADVKFNRYYITEEDSKDPNAFLNEARVVKVQQDKLHLTVYKDSYNKKYGNGFSAYFVTMDKGKVTEISRVTKNQRLISNTANAFYNGDNIFVYLDAAGGFNYEAFYTETGRAYYENAFKSTSEDVSIGIMDTIPGYVSTFLVSFIKISLYFPVILWFLAIEFFEIRRMRDRPRLTYGIGLVLYLLMKVLTFGSYYTELSMSQMPPMLLFEGAKYVYAIGIAVLAYLIAKLLKKHDPEMHLIAEFIIFALIDIEYTNLLYATYMV